MRRHAFAALLILLAACGGSSTGPDDGGGGGGGGTNRLTASFDGQAFTATTIQANPVAAVPGSLSFFGVQTVGGVARSLTISLAYIPGPGTYPLGMNIGTSPGGIVTVLNGTASYSTPLSGVAGSITITTLSATRAIGSFTFSATPVVGLAANLAVTNGVFDVPLSTGYLVPTADQAGSTLTATINGTANVAATVVGLGGGSDTRVLGGSNVAYSVSIVTGPYSAPTSGPLTGNVVPQRKLTITRVGTTQSWGGVGNDVGTFAITAITPTRIVGTFSGTLAPNLGATGNLVITNGAFSVRTPTP